MTAFERLRAEYRTRAGILTDQEWQFCESLERAWRKYGPFHQLTEGEEKLVQVLVARFNESDSGSLQERNVS